MSILNWGSWGLKKERERLSSEPASSKQIGEINPFLRPPYPGWIEPSASTSIACRRDRRSKRANTSCCNRAWHATLARYNGVLAWVRSGKTKTIKQNGITLT